jgi:hypothetical protein
MVLLLLLPFVIWLKESKYPGKSVKVFEQFDVRLIQGAIAAELLGFLGYSLSWTGSVYILSGIVSSLGIVNGPALQAGLVNHVTSDRSGEVLSACVMLHAAARLFTPTVMNTIYGATVGYFPQTIFILIIALGTIALIVSLFLKPNRTYFPFPLVSKFLMVKLTPSGVMIEYAEVNNNEVVDDTI